MPERGASSSSSGAVDETDFMTAWEEVQEARLFSIKDFPNELEKVKNILSNNNNDWEKRVDALRQLRSLTKISHQVDNFSKTAKELEIALRVSVKDLRSAVVREACITLSYLSCVLENKFEYLAEALLPAIINLIPNSVKIMSSSGHAAVRLIIKHTATPRIIPVIISNLLTSKSKEIRRRCGDYLGLLLEVWVTSVLKSHVTLIEEAIRKGISDADSEARAAVRRAYWHFADHYKSRADNMMQTFDSSKQKLLQSDKNLINAGVISPNKPTRTLSNLDLSNSSKKKQARNGEMPPPNYQPSMQRSASQLEYKSKNTPHMTPRQKSYDDMKRNTVARGMQREGRPRGPQRSAASQPSSRTTSPKRAMPVITRERSEDYMKTYNTQKTRIPTPAKPTSRSSSQAGSRQQSRDHSPVRMMGTGFDVRTRNGNQTPVTEDALWNAYKKNKTPRDRCNSQNSIGPGSDESDNSSISSHNSQNKRAVVQEYDEILNQLRQDSSSGKREGLLSLQAYLRGIKSLTTNEALVTRDLFNRYFAENNSKVHSLFLDVLSEFIVQYKNELQDWLFILLTRLLHRISSEVLTSAQTKIAMVLDVVRDSYPYDHQFQIITKYIMDNTQSPSLKMKVKLLQYLTGLISLMDLSDFQNTTPIRLAVSRIITWISEPKSPEVRKEAKAVIIALFQLNSAEFSMLLSSVPNSIQEGATRAIQGCLKSGGLERDMAGLSLEHTPNHFTPKQNSPIRKYSNEPYLNRSEPVKLTTEHSLKYHDIDYPIGPSSNDFSAMNIGDEKFDGEYNETPSRLSSSNKNRYAVADTHDMESFSSPILPTNQPANVIDSKVWLSNETSSYNPKQYEDPLLHSAFDDNTTDKIKAVDAADHTDGLHSTDDSQQKLTLLNQIATILSGARDASDSEGIKSSLLELLKLIRCGDEEVIPRLKAILPDVLLQLAHKEATIRCLAARTLREVAASWADAYRGNLNSFIIPLFEAEADKQKEVGKPAEECCKLLSMSLPAEELIPVLTPIIGSADYPINTSAIRMLHDICDHNCQQHVLLKYLNTVVCNLLKAYDHAESSVRKAAVFCLVSVHNLAGADVVTPYFKDLAGSKFKLLNLYIRRSQSANI